MCKDGRLYERIWEIFRYYERIWDVGLYEDVGEYWGMSMILEEW